MQNFWNTEMAKDIQQRAEYAHFYKTVTRNGNSTKKLVGTFCSVEDKSTGFYHGAFSLVSDNDNGCKKTGRDIALGRLLVALCGNAGLEKIDSILISFSDGAERDRFVQNAKAAPGLKRFLRMHFSLDASVATNTGLCPPSVLTVEYME